MPGFYFRQGQVISIAEAKIRFLPEQNPQRRPKKMRYMVVVMDEEVARDSNWSVVLACFIHSDPKAVTTWDIPIPAEQKAVPRLDAESWIVIPSLQPIRKTDVEADLGLLGLDIMGAVYRRLVEYTGMTHFMRQFRSR